MTRKRSLFYVVCPFGPFGVHTVCVDEQEGTFFWGHGATELDIMKAEADLETRSDIMGCHSFAALLAGPVLKITAFIIQEFGPGSVSISVFFSSSPMLLMYTSKATAFHLKTWIDKRFPGVSRWDKRK